MQSKFVKHLNDDAAHALLRRLLTELAREQDRQDADWARILLESLIEFLDVLDGEDFFGTEGWRHFLGFDDDADGEEEE